MENKSKIIWAISSILVLISSSMGILYPEVYENVLDPSILPATIAQDFMALIVSFLVIGLSLKQNIEVKQYLLVLGCLGFYFYAYMIYAIERLYNAYYLFYLAIVSLSFYGIIYSILSIDRALWNKISLPSKIRKYSSGYNIISALIFSVIWVSQLMPLMKTGTKPEFLYSIYIIDLCFILPLLVITAVLALRNNGLGVSMIMPTNVIGFSILTPYG